jgi:DNA-binding CsgD family transcriptional regulator/tetratricopeptide (TPR) repeat protein
MSGGDRPFIGRTEELDHLDGGLADTVAGKAAIVVVGGESGVGKTRLVTEFVTRARARGAIVLLGGCTDFGEKGPPYWAVLEALRPVWSQVGLVQPESVRPSMADAAASAGLRPGASAEGAGAPGAGPSGGLSEQPSADPGGPAPDVADPPGAGAIPLFERILWVLRALSERAPVVLVIEDVHWADRSTRDLTAFLLANLHQDPVMTILTYRSEALGRRHSLQPLLAELRRSRRAEFIDLQPFTFPEMVAQLHGILGRPPEEELVKLTWDRSDGNAFFAEELVAAVGYGYGNELPPTLRHILLCRIDVLPEAARRVLRLVAVASDRVSYPLLAEVAGVPDGDLVAALRDCVEHQLLAVNTDGDTYRFRHSLMQEVLYEELLPGERQIFHAAYGQALSRGLDRRPDSVAAAKLAYHWYAAGDPERALGAAVEAAGAAAAIYGFAEAQRHYERAIEVWEKVARPHEIVGLRRSDLFERAAEVAHLAGEHRRASHLIRAALSATDDSPSAERGTTGGGSGTSPTRPPSTQRAVRQQKLGRYLWAAGDSHEALKAYEEAVRSVSTEEASHDRASVEGAYAEALMLSGRYRASREYAEAALLVARQAGAQLEESQILATLGFDLAFLGDSTSGVMALERAQVIAEALGNPEDIGRAYLNRAGLFSGPLNRLSEAAEIAERGVARVRRLGLERTFGVALQAIAINTLFRLGRWPEADRLLQQSLAARPTGTAAIDLCLARAKLSVGRGDFEAAEADLNAVEDLAASGLGPRYEAPLLTLRAGVDLWMGRATQARQAVNRGILASVSGSDDVWLLAPLIWHGLRAEADIAEQSRARRDPAALESALTLAAGLQAQVENLADDTADAAPSILQAVEAYLRLCQGEASRAEGRPAPDVWADAARRWRELQQPYPSAYATWREAEALLARHSRSARAAELLRSAHQTAVRLGAVPFRREVESLARRARVTLAAATSEATAAAEPGADGRSVPAGQTPGTEPRVDAGSEAGTHAGSRAGSHGSGQAGTHASGQAATHAGTHTSSQARGIGGGTVAGADRAAIQARYGLSGRELEVWLLLPEGLTNNQIGQRLFISGKTASVHVTNILRKLAVKSRVQAIALAHQAGLVEHRAPPE